MFGDVKKIFDFFLKALPIVYFLGFLTISGYLSNYTFSEYNILNLTNLKAGVLISIYLSIIILSVYLSYNSETMTDNLYDAYPSMIASFFIVHLIICLSTMYIFEEPKFNFTDTILHNIITLIIIIFLFYIFWATSSLKNFSQDQYLLYVILPFLLFLIIVLAYRSYYNNGIAYLWGWAVAVSITTSLILGDIGDKKYNIKIVFDFMLIVCLSFFFGKYIYGEIPIKFGGGKAYYAIMSNKSILSVDSMLPKSNKVLILYENDSEYLIRMHDNTIQTIDKSDIKSIMLIPSKNQ